jgi:hypothetical protein
MCVRVAAIHNLFHACTGAFAHLPTDNRKVRPQTRTPEHRVSAKSCTKQFQNCVGTGANFSFRSPRLPSMPILL